jgi:hypothetical protein
MSLDRLYPEIAGDLHIGTRAPDDEFAFVLTRTDADAEGLLVAMVPDGAEYGVGEAQSHAVLLARSPTMLRLLREAFALLADEFEADDPVNGGDLVDLFGAWRRRAIAELSAPIEPAS